MKAIDQQLTLSGIMLFKLGISFIVESIATNSHVQIITISPAMYL